MTRIRRRMGRFAAGALLVLGGFAYAALFPGLMAGAAVAADDVTVEVYRTARCGCCSAWVDHLRREGFTVDAREIARRELNGLKREHGVTRALASCHTAFVDGYVIEGHVPAGEIRRLLDDRPKVAGLAVPGMPVGSPGMESGGRQDPYQVLAFRDGRVTATFATYE